MRAALALLLAGSLPLAGALADDAKPNRLTRAEIEDGWLLLFDGETLFGWEANEAANWRVDDGAIVASDGQPGLLCTTSEFANYELSLEFKSTKATNSGVFLRTPIEPMDPSNDCYELNIADVGTNPFPTGSFVYRKKADEVEPTPEWQRFHVVADGGHFTVKLDGKTVLEYTDPEPIATGRIGLQFRFGTISFRDIKLKPLGYESIFSGKDLEGWTVFPGRKSVFTVEEGTLRIRDGNGQIETVGQYDDFLLRMDVFIAGDGLNSGVFFRSIPGEFWQGYESQIQNAFQNDDPTDPVDYGTGAIYRRVKARRIVAKDKEWFTKTILAQGPHFAVWVDGYQVTDWNDPRPENENPRKGLRLAPGTIQLQGHDPTTDLRFKNILIAEYPDAE